MSREWYCNADFDLTLAHGGGKLPQKILAAARGMSWHFWPALPETDTLLVPAPPPESFLRYLASCGLRPPRFAVDTGVASSQSAPPKTLSRFTPFGWNPEAHRRNTFYPLPSPAPEASVVRKVNSRAFSAVKEKEIFREEACPAVFCRTTEDLKKWLKGAFPGRYVAKGNHGLAGIGQIRFEIKGEPQQEMTFLKLLSRLCARMDGVVLEEEQTILAEFGVLFRLDRSGRISPIRIHRLLSEIDGSFAGSLVLPEGAADAMLDPWRKIAEDSAVRIAAALCEEGYFGAVGVDMYVFEKEGRARFRSLADLNARCSMAWPVHGLAQCFQGRAVRVEHFSTARIKVPNDVDDVTSALNKLRLTPETRRGFIWLTPLLSLTRHSLAFVGNDETDVINVRNMTLELLALKG